MNAISLTAQPRVEQNQMGQEPHVTPSHPASLEWIPTNPEALRACAWREVIGSPSIAPPFTIPAYRNDECLDRAFRALLGHRDIGSSYREQASDCFGYHSTPLRLGLELISELEWRPGQVFLGCGCGRADFELFIGAATGMKVLGFDYDRGIIEEAKRGAAHLPWVYSELWVASAEFADIGRADHLYMYLPFRHGVHDRFMARVKDLVNRGKSFNLLSLGDTTEMLEELSWLQRINTGHPWDKIAIFRAHPALL